MIVGHGVLVRKFRIGKEHLLIESTIKKKSKNYFKEPDPEHMAGLLAGLGSGYGMEMLVRIRLA